MVLRPDGLTNMPPAAVLVEFVAGTSVYRERHRPSQFPIVRNGPPGTFVLFPDGFRVSVPTDQIVTADDTTGQARIGFGGMHFVGIDGERLVFRRVRELYPEEQLSPGRSHVMTLETRWVSALVVDGRRVWPD